MATAQHWQQATVGGRLTRPSAGPTTWSVPASEICYHSCMIMFEAILLLNVLETYFCTSYDIVHLKGIAQI
ncbi:MAG: hypothetical protein GFH25_541324n3 [Chloroflexi bacterium AL-N10]|nr:hypothetical protein [Chloroflexi bacterium AL-N10]